MLRTYSSLVQGAVQAEKEGEFMNTDLDEEEEGEASTHNIFNPEVSIYCIMFCAEDQNDIFPWQDAGLLLGDIMMFTGDEQRVSYLILVSHVTLVSLQWGQEEDDGLGSWGIVHQHQESFQDQGSESGSEGVQSGQWDPTGGSMEWEEDDDPFTSI